MSSGAFWGVVIVLWILWVVLGGVIGHAKNRTGTGVVLGLLLGLIGVIIISCMKKYTPPGEIGDEVLRRQAEKEQQWHGTMTG